MIISISTALDQYTSSYRYPFYQMAQFLPNEILLEIFKNDSQNINFLHSCLLVNTTWSLNVIPILWNQPFHLLLHCNKKYSHHIISTYLKNHATHNYHSFLRHLSFFSFFASVQEWCTLNLQWHDPVSFQIPEKLFSLFADFSILETLDFFKIECLFKLDLSVCKLTNLMNVNIFNLVNAGLIKNTKVCEWISKVKNVFLKGEIIGRYDFSMILYACRNIKTLKVRLPYYESGHYYSTLDKICQFIELQQKLESFTLYKSEFHFKIGDALKNHKYSLRHIEFSDIQIVRTDYLDWILLFDNLESLLFIDTAALPWLFKINQPNQPTLKKLKYLVIKEYFCFPFDFIISIIRSSNIKLQEIELEWPKDQQGGLSVILESISYHCSNLTKLGATVGAEEFPTLLGLLNNCRKLKILEIYGNDEVLDVDGFFPELGLFISYSLVELVIGANWRFKPNSLLTFFENSKHIQLYKVVFKFCDFINNDHLDVIANYSMDSLKYITLKDETFANTDLGISNASIWLKSLFDDI